jgi:hypothetical protein
VKFVSFALFGSHEIYACGALQNASLTKEFFPDWKAVFYVDPSISESLVRSLESKGALVFRNPQMSNGSSGMFWRYQAASLPGASAIVFRDCDSRLGIRDFAAVEEWLSSKASLHVIRDHPYHSLVMMGGLWGIRGKDALARLVEILRLNKPQTAEYGDDQKFLAKYVYPEFLDSIFVHDEFFNYEKKAKHLPRRVNWEFLGERIGCQGEVDRMSRLVLKRISRNPIRRYIHLFQVAQSNSNLD